MTAPSEEIFQDLCEKWYGLNTLDNMLLQTSEKATFRPHLFRRLIKTK